MVAVGVSTVAAAAVCYSVHQLHFKAVVGEHLLAVCILRFMYIYVYYIYTGVAAVRTMLQPKLLHASVQLLQLQQQWLSR